MRIQLFSLLAGALATAAPAAVEASISFDISTNSPLAGANYVNFDDLPPKNAGGQAFNTLGTDFITVALTPASVVPEYDGAQAVTGDEGGHFAAPYVTSLDNGAMFGNPQADGKDETQYLTSGIASSNGAISLTFNSAISYFGMLWGSIDNYNTLTFLDASDNVIGVFTGSTIDPAANGDQGVNGTFYVNFFSDSANIKSVVATSSQYAFEFDNVAYSANAPEAATLAIWSGLGLCGAAIAYRKSRRQA